MLKSIHSVRPLALAVGALALSGAAHAQFFEVASLEDVRNNPNSAAIQAFFFEGSTLYVGLGGSNQGGGVFNGQAINRVTGIGGTPVVTTLMDETQWGTTNAFFARPFSKTGNVLQFVSTINPLIYRLDVSSAPGTLTQRFTTADINAGAGFSNFNSGTAGANDVAGELIFANVAGQNSGVDRALLRTNGSDIDVLLNATQLAALFSAGTNPSVNALGIAGDIVYLGNNNSNALGTFNTSTSATSIILDQAALTGVLGGTGVNFVQIFPGPDGLVYFATTNRAIASFNPADPAGTLSMVVADAGAVINGLGWFSDEDVLAFSTNVGIYAIPEPRVYAALVGLLALGFVVYRRRR